MSNFPQAVIDATYGPMVAGLMIQQLLLGIICVQVSNYYLTFPNDALFYKSLVGLLVGLNIVHGVIDFHVLYRITVTYYGNFEGFDLQTWSAWAEPAVTSAIGTVAQIFFLERCYRAFHSRPVIAVLALMVLTSFGFGLALSISFGMIQRLSRIATIYVSTTGCMISAAVTDLAIALVLVFGLIRSKTPFEKTERVIFRIVRLSMETSSATAFVALLTLIFYYALPGKAYYAIPHLSACRIYTHAVLITLASRTEMRNILLGDGHSSYVTHNAAVADEKWQVQSVKVTTVAHERISWQEDPTDVELGRSKSKDQHDYDDNSFGDSKTLTL